MLVQDSIRDEIGNVSVRYFTMASEGTDGSRCRGVITVIGRKKWMARGVRSGLGWRRERDASSQAPQHDKKGSVLGTKLLSIDEKLRW